LSYGAIFPNKEEKKILERAANIYQIPEKEK
jgi:hypothetical protein